MEFSTMKIGLLFLIFCVLFKNSEQVKFDEDLKLTRSQKKVLDEFKKVMLPRLTKDYQKEDIYLIRWLRAKNFNLRQAENLLLQDIKWRKDEKMDGIHDEDWSDMEMEYPYYLDGFDNEGKPILSANFDEWDIRKAAVSGKIPRLMRWMTKGQDEAVRMVRDLQKKEQNVTQWDFIINMNNFNLVQHGCVACLPIYVNYVSNYENHFPGSCDKIMLLNTPQVFEVVLNLIRPVMSPQTREALKVYSNNKDEWDHIVYSDIKRDQLPKEYGGTKVRQ